MFPNDGETVDDLLRNVDSAMYHAKAAGRNNYQFFNDSMSANASERLTLQSSLHQAIAKRQFVLHYQPQIETGSGRLMGVEVLVRWEHPERGLVPPNKFIPIAEESDLIIRLGEWILQEAVASSASGARWACICGSPSTCRRDSCARRICCGR